MSRRPARPHRKLTTDQAIMLHRSAVAANERKRDFVGREWPYEEELMFRAEDGDQAALEYMEEHLAPWMTPAS